jgi:hypothetical protein
LTPASAPPRSYGHRVQLAKDTSRRGSTCHWAHKTVYFPFPAAQLPSCLSPAEVASLLPPLPALFLPRASYLQNISSTGCAVTRWDGSGGYFGDNDAHLNCINVLYHEALGAKYVPRTTLFDFGLGMTGAVPRSRRTANFSARVSSCTIRAGENWAKGHYKKG